MIKSLKGVIIIIYFVSGLNLFAQNITNFNSIQNDSLHTAVPNKSKSLFLEPSITLLIGLLLGLFARNTEFKKFLLQKRIEVFSDFLSKAEPCRRKALTSIVSAKLSEKFDYNTIPGIISDVYWPIIIDRFKVNLVLNRKHRDEFINIIDQLISLTIESHVADVKDLKTTEINECFKDIENIFNQSIKESKSPFWLLSRQ